MPGQRDLAANRIPFSRTPLHGLSNGLRDNCRHLLHGRDLLRDVARGFAIDSGSVQVQHDDGAITARIDGSGLENAIRTPAWIDFRDVPLSAPSDTVPCRYQP